MSVPFVLLAAVLATAGMRQQPASTPPRPSSNVSDDRVATLATPAPVVVEGCVVTEREVKGRPSGIGERTGLDNHFVLTAAKVLKGKAPAGAGDGPVTYGIDALTDEQLKVHVGRRVRIDGTFGSLDRGATPADSPADSKEGGFLQLSVATIRQIPGDCSILQN